MITTQITQPKNKILYVRHGLVPYKNRVSSIIVASGYNIVTCANAYAALKIVNTGGFAGAVVGDST